MIHGLVSIIVPTYQHRQHVASAVHSAMLAGAKVPGGFEVIVVDDGSTDGSSEHLRASFGAESQWLTIIRTEVNRGVAWARNTGIEHARGEFVQFLDADDTISAEKLVRQLEVLDDEAGWVLCDTSIVGTDGRQELASARYDYAAKALDGWVAPLLVAANFIPVHAPLVRRSVLGDSIRFPADRNPEDWHFWHAVASAARCRYLPEVLARYVKRHGGRNTTSPRNPRTVPGVVPPLRLNLGCGTPDTRSWHPMPGLVNLDRSLGWRFEDGLGDYVDGSVAGITVSHALMYVDEGRLPYVLGEFARVLEPGGVLRITEDNTEHPESSRRGGWRGSEPAVTLTGPRMMRRHLEAVGFTVHDVPETVTHFRDSSLRQAQHGAAPDCFWIEGIRECAVLFEPHADDGVLFAAFSIIRHRPRVVTCYPSEGDYGDTATRAAETAKAVGLLGGGPCEQWNGYPIEEQMRELDARLRPTIVFAPSPESSHAQHVGVADCARRVFGGAPGRLRQYHTYRQLEGGAGHAKVRRGELVPHEPGWAERKRIALACYRTQLAHPRARRFFEDDLAEYLAS